MANRFSSRNAIAIAVAVTLSGCDCGSGIELFDDGGRGLGSDGGRNGGSRDGGSNGGGTGGGLGTGGGGGGGGSSTAVEVCDGIDNDNDGIIDNVDVGKDGVCDCLKIATLGYKGTAGVGDVFNNWLNGKSIAGAADLDRQELTLAKLSQYQVVVVQNVRRGSSFGVGQGIGRSYSQAEIEALRTWVNNGGGIMTLIGYSDPTEVLNVNSLMAPFGLRYDNIAILAKTGNSTVPITHWVSHPLADNVKILGVDNGYEVLGEGDGGVALVAYSTAPGTYDLLRATTYGQGHVFMWGDEWITFDSEWKDHPDYQVERFWLNALKWLTPVNQCQVSLPVIN